MKIDSYIQSGCLIVFWSVSFMIPFADNLLPDERPLHTGAKEHSISWLSLPMGLVARLDPLSGWNALCRQDSRIVSTSTILLPGHGADMLDDALVEEPGLERIQLFGVISQESRPVYCFYDPMNNKWFNLSEGEANNQIGVLLVKGSKKDCPHLVDLENGKHFRIHSRNWLLSPLAGTSDSTMESSK